MLKADGLALGKGVLICNTLEEAKEGVRTIMEDKKFGTAGNTMVVEEFMTGREVSVLSFVDGKTIKIMSSAQTTSVQAMEIQALIQAAWVISHLVRSIPMRSMISARSIFIRQL